MKYTYISVWIIQPSAQCSFYLKMHFLLTLLSRFISHWNLSKGLESFINASNMAHLTAVIRRDEALHFIKYWSEDYILNTVLFFFQECMEGNLYLPEVWAFIVVGSFVDFKQHCHPALCPRTSCQTKHNTSCRS